MAENEKKELFISYCTKNKDLAQLFCNVVEGAGVSCWMAPRDIPSGGSWATSIAKGVEDASILALLVSDASMSSLEVEKEVDLANGRRMTILPIRIENTELKGAFKYHLSNKQWVDAMDEDQTSRYKDSIVAILQNLGKASSDGDKSGTGYPILARILANELNQEYAESLKQINSLCSARDLGAGRVEIFFPFRLGATGVDLKCQFDAGKQMMKIFADLAIMDDLLKYPFCTYAEQLKKEFFPRAAIQTYARREQVVIFEPDFPLAIGRVNLTEEKLFGLFRDNVVAFFEKIMPDLLAWANYGQYIVFTISELTERLKKEFPESQGWRVGAPERERLDAFNSNPKSNWMHFGKINIYKESWVPEPPLSMGNPNGRGLLSFTLESGDSFLDKLSIGILKYEPWYDMDGLKEKLHQAIANAHLSGSEDSRMAWRQGFDDDWQSSGIKSRDYCWQSKGNEFIAYCVERFTKLKELECSIDEICAVLPELQTKSIEWFLTERPDRQKWNDGLYIYNRLRIIAEDISPNVLPHGLTVSFNPPGHFNDWAPKEIYMGLKVGNFDAVASIYCDRQSMMVKITNLEPPDFETEVIQAFIKERGIYDVKNETIKVQSNFDAGTEAVWFDRFAAFVSKEVDMLLPEFIALKKHLEEVVDLAAAAGKIVAQALGGETGDWKVENKAVSLEKMAPISIWHSSWRRKGAKDDDLPPVMLQIIPMGPCFDGLVISIRENEQFDPKFEHRLWMVCGAFEFAFGKSHDADNLYGIWSANLPEFSNTGGSKFIINQIRRPLIAGEEKAAFGECLQGVAKSIVKMAPFIASLCADHNFQHHFTNELSILINELTKALHSVFPKEEGWIMWSSSNPLERWSGIRFHRKSWQRSDQTSGAISIAIEAQSVNFDDLCYGIIDIQQFTAEQREAVRTKMESILVPGRQSKTWPWYNYAEAPFRKTGGVEQKVIDEKTQSEMRSYFRDKFRIMKEQVAPLIDKLLAETTDSQAKQAGSEAAPT